MTERLDIQGGEHLLPFARSRIKALRALGLANMAQRYAVDGVMVTVRIDGVHNYIRIEGGSGRVYMDSGLVDLIEGNEMVTNYGLPGILYETASMAAYNLPFAIDSDARGVLRRYAAGRPHNQISGIVDFTAKPSFEGRVPQDGEMARSFAKPRIKAPDTDPPAFQTDESENEALLEKKKAGLACPASMFTGRCRLLVQALFGAHLHKYPLDLTDKDGLSEPLENSSFIPSVLPFDGGPPKLRLSFTTDEGAAALVDEVIITTNTGVAFDKITWKHTLINLESGNFVAYPLVASKAGEQLRQVGKKSVGKFSSDDIARMEAYILSSSRPNASKRKVIVSVSDVSLLYSMGYGWHWNWSGTAADIAVNKFYKQEPENFSPTSPLGMESTHYRITLSTAKGSEHPALRTSGSLTTVSGPTRWAAPRGLWVFCEPNWTVKQIAKTTYKYTIATTGSATFYVFYKGDVLQLCTFTLVNVPAGDPTRVRTDPYGGYAGEEYGGHTDGITYGSVGGYVEDRLPAEAHAEATISIGSAIYSGLASSYAVEGSFQTVADKTMLADYPIPSSGYNPASAGPPISGTEGYPPYTNWTSPDLVRVADSFTGWSWTTEEGSKDYILFGQSVVVVPMYDSEAIFIWTRRTTKTTTVATKKIVHADSWAWGHCYWIQRWDAFSNILGYDPHVRFEPAPAYGIGVIEDSVFDSSIPTTDTLEITQHLISKTGTYAATFGSIDDQFFDNDVEIIGSTYIVNSGVNLNSPFVMSPGRIETVGGTPALDTSSDITILTHPTLVVGYI